MNYKYYLSDFNLIVTIGAEYTNSGGALVTLDNTAEFNFRFYTADKENPYVCSSTGGVSPVLTRCTKLGTDKVVCHFDRSVLELNPGQLYLEAEFIVPDAKFEGDDKENVVRLYKTDVTLTMAPDKDTEGEFEVMIGADFLKGADGKSAYQAALDGGFVGTEAEFNAAIAGLSPDDNNVPVVAAEGTRLIAETGRYYHFGTDLSQLEIILPAMTDNSKLYSLVVAFTTASSVSSFTISSADSKPISYYSGYNIEEETSYELNIMYNGSKWVVAYGIIE